jgi:hypothetical protein
MPAMTYLAAPVLVQAEGASSSLEQAAPVRPSAITSSAGSEEKTLRRARENLERVEVARRGSGIDESMILVLSRCVSAVFRGEHRGGSSAHNEVENHLQ